MSKSKKLETALKSGDLSRITQAAQELLEELRLEKGRVIKSNGIIKWYKDGKLHREDGPAVLYPIGAKEWWLNGKRHREDGPAVESSPDDDTMRAWYLNGKLIKIDNDEDNDLPEKSGKDYNWELMFIDMAIGRDHGDKYQAVTHKGKHTSYNRPDNWDELVADLHE